jgi:hypothetical protein
VSGSSSEIWNQEGSIYNMEVAAAAAFVAVTLFGSGLYQILKRNLWVAAFFIALNAGTAFWLATAASLWPFYVLGGAQCVALILVIIAAAITAYIDAEEAKELK